MRRTPVIRQRRQLFLLDIQGLLCKSINAARDLDVYGCGYPRSRAGLRMLALLLVCHCARPMADHLDWTISLEFT